MPYRVRQPVFSRSILVLLLSYCCHQEDDHETADGNDDRVYNNNGVRSTHLVQQLAKHAKTQPFLVFRLSLQKLARGEYDAQDDMHLPHAQLAPNVLSYETALGPPSSA